MLPAFSFDLIQLQYPNDVNKLWEQWQQNCFMGRASVLAYCLVIAIDFDEIIYLEYYCRSIINLHQPSRDLLGTLFITCP